MKISLIILKILFVGALLIVHNQNLHLSNTGERDLFIESYFAWVGSMAEQGIKVTGYVVKLEWLPPKDPQELRELIDSRNKS